MSKIKVRWLDRRIAAAGPFLALCLSEQEFKAVVAHLELDSKAPWISNNQSDATTHFFSTNKNQLACAVCISDCAGRDPVEVAGLLVHEAVHVWQEYADSIGERAPGREQEAYAIQSIAQELMAEFARRALKTGGELG